MTARYRLSVLSVLLFVASLAPAMPACYTLIRHPRTQELKFARPSDKRCRGCHSDRQIWSFNHSSARRLNAGRYDERWTRYYEVPWWYEHHWGYRLPADSLSAQSFDGSTRPADGDGQEAHAVAADGSRSEPAGAREVHR